MYYQKVISLKIDTPIRPIKIPYVYKIIGVLVILLLSMILTDKGDSKEISAKSGELYNNPLLLLGAFLKAIDNFVLLPTANAKIVSTAKTNLALQKLLGDFEKQDFSIRDHRLSGSKKPLIIILAESHLEREQHDFFVEKIIKLHKSSVFEKVIYFSETSRVESHFSDSKLNVVPWDDSPIRLESDSKMIAFQTEQDFFYKKIHELLQKNKTFNWPKELLASFISMARDHDIPFMYRVRHLHEIVYSVSYPSTKPKLVKDLKTYTEKLVEYSSKIDDLITSAKEKRDQSLVDKIKKYEKEPKGTILAFQMGFHHLIAAEKFMIQNELPFVVVCDRSSKKSCSLQNTHQDL